MKSSIERTKTVRRQPGEKIMIQQHSTEQCSTVDATMLLYISVCLRTRRDTISYSFTYITQKAEFRWMADKLQNVSQSLNVSTLVKSSVQTVLRNVATIC